MADSKVFYTDILLRKDYLDLNLFQRDLYWRMWCYSDYHGRYHADPEIIRGHFYAKELNKTREADIERALEAIARTSLVHFYTVDSSAYFEIPAEIHRQRIRSKSKFPTPPCRNLPQSAATCRNLPQSAAQIEIEEEKEKEEEREEEKENYTSAPPTAPQQTANTPSPSKNDYLRWITAIKNAHPAGREVESFRGNKKLLETARATYAALPNAAADAPLLRAYYDSPITTSSKTGRPFKRPLELLWYLTDLPDILAHARQWAREMRWKPAGTPRPAKTAPAAPAEPQELATEQDKIDLIAEIRAACSTIATPPPSVPPQDFTP